MNLFTMLDRLAAQAPDQTAAVDAEGTHLHRVTRAALRDRSLALAADLAERGVTRGDCIAVWLPNWSSALVWQFAASALGAHVVGVNTRYNTDEVTHILSHAQPRVIAVAHQFHGLDLIGILRSAVANVDGWPPQVAVVAGPRAEAPQDTASYDVGAGAWCPSAPAHLPPSGRGASERSLDGSELAVAFATSGSTGMPKLAAHRGDAVVAHSVATAQALGVTPGDMALCVLPLSGVFGFNTAMTALAGGGGCLLEPVFDAPAVLDHMAELSVTHVVGGDDLVGKLADSWHQRPVGLPSWRWLGIADFLGRSVMLAGWAHTEFGTLTSGVYGSSEVLALTAFWGGDEPSPRRWRGGGHVHTPGVRARVVDPVSAEPSGTGQEGELQLTGPNVVDAYLGSDTAAAVFTPDGWFRTGDLCTEESDGSFLYVCRMGDVLRLHGFLVDPAEIETRLVQHTAVRVAKVVGVRGRTGSNEAVGFVIADAPVTPDEIRQWCAGALARFKVPSVIHIVDELPTTSGTNGTKIRAAALREQAQLLYDAKEQA
ncbi:AMP-binding protein [Streptomyces shenzhenensis]|uniref:AMP-binding protein n=1 Tax=Streptomyces shenzhenensis TaxID=943815 RepID=UPI0033F331BD